jgi:hypothetical protein
VHFRPWSDPLLLHALPRLAVAGALIAVSWSSARAFVRRRVGELTDDAATCATATLLAALLTAPALALASFGRLAPVPWLIGAALAAAALALAARGPSVVHVASAADDPGPSWPFSLALGGFAIGRALFVLRNPPADVDSLIYHLPMTAYWMRSGSLGVAVDFPPRLGHYFPGNVEVLQMLMAWAGGRETLMPWVGVVGIALLALALRRVCIMMGARRGVGEITALSLSLAPGLVQITMGTRIEPLLTAWFAIALLFALRFGRERSPADLGVALLAAGLAAGSKTLGPAYAAFALTPAVLGAGWRESLRALWRCRVGLVFALLIGGFWIARNLAATGNPLFPAPLHLGPLRASGILSASTLSRTSQVEVWREGFAGQLTLRNLVTFCGPLVYLAGLGLAVWLANATSSARGRQPAPSLRRERAGLAAIALVSFGLFLVVPFSGASEPAAGGQPPVLANDSVRYLYPTFAAALPLVAVGLSAIPISGVLTGAMVILLGAALRHSLAHIGLGVVLALPLSWLGGRFAKRAGLAAAAMTGIVIATGLALTMSLVEPGRERVADLVWSGYVDHFRSAPLGAIRALREEVKGRPIACVGVYAWWPFYGRDFTGRPVYVPVGMSWAEGSRPYHFEPDPRDRADRSVWLANLEQSGAKAVVIGTGNDSTWTPPVEAQWCAEDTARFLALPLSNHLQAYLVRAP